MEIVLMTIEHETAKPFFTRKRFVLSSTEEADKLRKLVLDGNGRIVYTETVKVMTADEVANEITNEAKEWLKSMGVA